MPRALTEDAVFVTSAWLAVLQKGAADLDDPSPVDAEHIYQQLLADYPPDSITWVRELPWVGPVEIPLDGVDWDDKDSWAASHQKKRVKRFAKRIRTGDQDVNPVVGVKVPGDDRLKVIDGHHRALAYKKEGKPVKAYVGTAPSSDASDPWFQAHLYQLHNGSATARKSEASDWEPVSFARLTASGKVIISIADLVKVGKEGYIHGFICVRPPCGKYKDAVHNVKNGQILHGESNAKIGQQLKKEEGHAGYSAQHILPNGKKGEKLAPQYATRADAAKALVVYHNMDAMHRHAASGGASGAVLVPISNAKKAFAAGNHEDAKSHLVSAELAANQSGDFNLGEHLADVRAAITTGLKTGDAHPPEKTGLPPKVPVIPVPAAPDHEAAVKDLSDFAKSFKNGDPGYKSVNGAVEAAEKGDYATASARLSLASKMLNAAYGPGGGSQTAKDLSARFSYLQQLPKPEAKTALEVKPVDAPKPPPLGPKLSEADEDIFSSAIGATALGAKHEALKGTLQDARDALADGQVDEALHHLKVANTVSGVVGDKVTADRARTIHNNIATKLGKPLIPVPKEPAVKPPPAPKVKPKPPEPGVALAQWEKDLLEPSPAQEGQWPDIADAGGMGDKLLALHSAAKGSVWIQSRINDAYIEHGDGNKKKAVEWLDKAHDEAMKANQQHFAHQIKLVRDELAASHAADSATSLESHADSIDHALPLVDPSHDAHQLMSDASIALHHGDGNHALAKLKEAHGTAASNSMLSSVIAAEHDKLADTLGKPASEHIMPVKASAPGLTTPQTLAHISNVSSLKHEFMSHPGTGKTVTAIDDAYGHLEDNEPQKALTKLNDAVVSADDDNVPASLVAQLTEAHNSLASDLGKPELPVPSAAPADGKLTADQLKNHANALHNLSFTADNGYNSGSFSYMIGKRIGEAHQHVINGEPQKALQSLNDAHGIAQDENADGIAKLIAAARDNLATDLAGKLAPSAPAAPAKALQVKDISPDVAGDIKSHLFGAIYGSSSVQQPELVSHLDAAKNALEDKNWSSVFEHVSAAHDIASAKKLDVEGSISDAKGLLMAHAVQPVPVKLAKKLSKAKKAQLDKELVTSLDVLHDDSGYVSDENYDAIRENLNNARTALKNDDLSTALSHVNEAHAHATDAKMNDAFKNRLAHASDAIAEHTGGKPVQARTITKASGLGERVAVAVNAVKANGHTANLTALAPSLDSTDQATAKLREGKAADVIRSLRASDEALKQREKLAYGDQVAAYASSRKAIRSALAAVEKEHDKDLAEKSFRERAEGLIPASQVLGSYNNPIRLKNAADYADKGNTNAAIATLNAMQRSLSKSWSSPMEKALATDVKKLKDSLNKKNVVKPDSLVDSGHKGFSTSRPGDVGATAAEHFFVTGNINGSEKLHDALSKGPSYKAKATKLIADEMASTSVEDLAKIAQHNKSYNRINSSVVSAVAERGLGAVAVNKNMSDVAHRFRVKSSEDKYHLEAVKKAIDRFKGKSEMTPEARMGIAMLSDIDLADNGMPYNERKRLTSVTQGKDLHEPEIDALRKSLQDHYDRIAAGKNLDPEDERLLKAELAGSLVQLWASSSNNEHVPALSVQRAVAHEFNLPGHLEWQPNNTYLQDKVEKFYQEHKETLHKFVRAQYDLTQRELAAAGIESVTLHRGMRWASGGQVPEWAKTPGSGPYASYNVKSPGSIVETKSSDWRPISSWSHSSTEANAFYTGSGVGMQVKASIPAHMVFSTPRTGNGCLHEKEWVVLGGDGQLSVTKSRS
jgi:ParB-like nuclease domain